MAGIRFIQRHGIALLALFVALGGTTYAAVGLPANSVGTKQLQRGAVTRVKIRNNAVNGVKIANNSITGADIAEATLGKVPSAARADAAVSATHATTAKIAGKADRADTAASADNALKLGGAPPLDYQRRVTGTCPSPKAITAVAADGTVTCGSAVSKIAFDAPSGGVNDPVDALPFLHVGAGCNLFGTNTFVAFVNTGSDAATLNWVYSDGATVSATGVLLAAGTGEMDVAFNDARIEGQFIFANGAGVTTINLHAFDGGAGGCEIRGTEAFSAG
jgi:hypothetical protein